MIESTSTIMHGRNDIFLGPLPHKVTLYDFDGPGGGKSRTYGPGSGTEAPVGVDSASKLRIGGSADILNLFLNFWRA